jgi:NADH:ubiquinone oxidoreductase subunit 3 (subunit A)
MRIFPLLTLFSLILLSFTVNCSSSEKKLKEVTVSSGEVDYQEQNWSFSPFERRFMFITFVILMIIMFAFLAILSLNIGSHFFGRYDGGRYDGARYDSGRYDSGRYDSARYDSGRPPAY